MSKEDKKNGAGKKPLDKKHKQTEKQEKIATDESSVPKGKLKWSKEDEQQSDKHTNDQPNKKEPHGEEAEKVELTPKQPVQDEAISATDDAPADKETTETDALSADSTPSLTKSKKYSLEDTLGPIDFKEYSIDPEEKQADSEETSGQKRELNTQLKPDPKLQKEAIEAQESKPFVFSSTTSEESNEDVKKPKKKKPKKTKVTKVTKKSKTVKAQKTKDQIKKARIMLAVKILWLPITLLVVLITSLIIGHTTIGGQPASDIFNMDMWMHLYDLIFTK